MAENLDKKKARDARWREAHRINLRERQRIWRLNNKDKKKQHALKSTYGISLEEYNKLLEDQEGKCSVCQHEPGQRALHVDHNHITGIVRGLLCSKCNVALGMVDESPELLMKLIDYLRRYE